VGSGYWGGSPHTIGSLQSRGLAPEIPFSFSFKTKRSDRRLTKVPWVVHSFGNPPVFLKQYILTITFSTSYVFWLLSSG